MAGKKKDAYMTEVELEAAAARMNVSQDEADLVIESAQEVTAKQPDLLLGLNQHEPEISFSTLGIGRGNTAARQLTAKAAEDHKLPSPLFEALEVRFSDITQAATAVPVQHYDKHNPRHAPVYWSRNGREFSVEMKRILEDKQWMVPIGQRRLVKMSIRRHHPERGTNLILWFKDSTVFNVPKKGASPAVKTEAGPGAAQAGAPASSTAAAKAEEPSK